MKWFIMLLAAALVVVPTASAEVVTNEKIPVTLNVFVPCAAGGAGEVISISGNLHVLIAVTLDDTGGFHYKDHFQPQGLRGQGLTTGDKYQGTGVTQFQMNVSAASLPYEFTYVNNFRMIGQGPGNNFTVHENVHVRVNADGTATAEVDNFKVECK